MGEEEILSQEEVDALLRGVGDGELETETDEIAENISGVEPFDLTTQEKVISGRLPTLNIINQMFCKLFQNTFSKLMRRSVQVSTISTNTIKFGDFQSSLPFPSCLHIFRMEPLRGHGLVVMENKLISAVIDTIFGGTGTQKTKITGRDFSSIEIRMIKSIIISALEDLEKSWRPVHTLTTNLVRSEVNPQFAAIVTPNDVVLVVLFKIEMENISGTLTICLPYAAIKPIIPKLKTEFQSEKMEVDHVWVSRLRAKLLTAELELVAELGTTTITPQDLMKYKVGDTIILGADVTDPLLLKVEQIPKFKGFSGVSRGNKAVQLAEKIQREG
ncbi:MAG: flagellar motor switch protein FliM [Nitrospinales bacterium]|nr:flagellar motor switch protein FliM [Nitrospinales bacterium]